MNTTGKIMCPVDLTIKQLYATTTIGRIKSLGLRAYDNYLTVLFVYLIVKLTPNSIMHLIHCAYVIVLLIVVSVVGFSHTGRSNMPCCRHCRQDFSVSCRVERGKYRRRMWQPRPSVVVGSTFRTAHQHQSTGLQRFVVVDFKRAECTCC